MSDELKWVVGMEITIATALLGALLTAFYRLADAVKKGDDHLADIIKKGDDDLHARINGVREEYVRRPDLDGHMSRIDTSMHDLRSEIKDHARDTQRRLDTVLTALKCPIPQE